MKNKIYKELRFGVGKRHFNLYLIIFCIGSIILLLYLTNDKLVAIASNLGTGLIISSVFAYFIDLINNKMNNDKNNYKKDIALRDTLMYFDLIGFSIIIEVAKFYKEKNFKIAQELSEGEVIKYINNYIRIKSELLLNSSNSDNTGNYFARVKRIFEDFFDNKTLTNNEIKLLGAMGILNYNEALTITNIIFDITQICELIKDNREHEILNKLGKLFKKICELKNVFPGIAGNILFIESFISNFEK